MAITSDTKPLDQKIDAVFGEQVVFKPMTVTTGGYREAVVDASRPETIATGIYDQTRGANEATGSGFVHTQASVGVSLSIRMEPILQCQLRKGDRVYFPERNELYDVSHIYEDPGGRWDVHILRVLE